MKINTLWCLAAAVVSVPITPASAQSVGVSAGMAGIFVYRQVPLPGGNPSPNSGTCVVQLGQCEPLGSCSVNLGYCDDGGSCTVNRNLCQNGGSCVVNMGDCGNGDESTVCYNTACDSSNPGADMESYSGFMCRFDGGNEASGVVFNDPTKEFGKITAGPLSVTVSDPTTNTVADVNITCTMQSVAQYGSGGVSRTNTTQGNTGVLVDTISFNRAPYAPSYLCTTVTWNSTVGTSVIIYDSDNDTSNGYQCAEYTYTN